MHYMQYAYFKHLGISILFFLFVVSGQASMPVASMEITRSSVCQPFFDIVTLSAFTYKFAHQLSLHI